MHPERDVELRPATAEDAAEMAELYLATRREAVPAMPPQVHGDADVHAHISRDVDRHEVWVAVVGDELAGFLVLTGTWLDSLYVGPRHQGAGIGTALLELAKVHRPGGFSLWVFASNAPARGFYHRHGLIELEHTDGSANEEHSPDVRMAWPGTDPIGFLRHEIDHVDEDLALLLARRFALTSAVQGFKPTGGHRDRDVERERAIAERMAAHTPGLSTEALGRIMHAVIGESLDAFEPGSGG